MGSSGNNLLGSDHVAELGPNLSTLMDGRRRRAFWKRATPTWPSIALTFAGAIVLAGCSSSLGETDADSTVSQQSPTGDDLAPTTVPAPLNGSGQADGAVGEEDGLSSHERVLKDFAEAFVEGDPPEVEVVRVVSGAERPDVMFECLTEAGFPVERSPSGSGHGMTFASPDQMTAYDLATYVCMAQYPLDPRHDQVLTDAQLAIYHDWLVENTVACMREREHPVAEPPSVETFIANYRARGELNFFADDLPRDQEAEIMGDVLEHCETEPPLELLFSD